MIISFLPEIFIAISAILILLYGVYKKQNVNNICINIGFIVLLIALILLIILNHNIGGMDYNIIKNQLSSHQDKYKLFKFDDFSLFSRYFVIISSLIMLIISKEYLNHKSFARFEFTSIYLVSVVGLLLAVLSYNLFTLYISLELAMISIVYLVTYKRRAHRSTEAGMKYVITHLFSSSLIIFAISIIYGYSGHLNYDHLLVISENYKNSYMFIIAFIILMIGILSKLALFPLNLCFPDVSEGAPTAVSGYLISTVQSTFFLIITKLVLIPFAVLISIWQIIFMITASLSLFVGAIASTNQENIKRLYSFISMYFSGLFLLYLINPTLLSISALFYFIIYYSITMMLCYSVIMALRIKGDLLEHIQDLSGLFFHKRLLTLAITILFVAIIGLPPTAGFIAKVMMFIPLINSKSIFIITIIVLSNLIIAYSLLKILKLIYFNNSISEIDAKISPIISILITILTLITVILFINPNILVKYCIMVIT